MSDHWNSLANLLGTPSVDPLHRKATTPSTPEKTSAKKFDDEAPKRAVIDPLPTPVESKTAEPESKPEPPSRIRASWDAVARMFGVAPPQEAPAKLPEPKSSSLESLTTTPADDDLFAGFSRGRSERNRSSSNVETEKSERPASSSQDAPRRGSARQERVESSEQKQDSSRKRRPPSFWESSDEPKSEQREPERTFVDDEPITPESRSVPREHLRDSDEDGDQAERRGRRRNIRRGRDSADTPVEQPRAEADSRERREPRSNEERAPRGERPAREARPVRDDRPPRVERPVRDDRPPREDRSARDDRPPREARPVSDGRAPRGDRPARGERGERDPSGRGRGGRPNDGRREEPVSRSRPERSRSEELDHDELPEESSIEAREVRSPAREESEGDEGAKRRRRRRGGSRRRGSSDDVRDDRSDESLDDTSAGRQAYGQHMNEEDDEDGERITKITSWIDAISPMIDSNMENHKKNSGQDHRGRGRGNQRGGGGGSRRRGGQSSHRD